MGLFATDGKRELAAKNRCTNKRQAANDGRVRRRKKIERSSPRAGDMMEDSDDRQLLT
jgi:hypothetical protein